jgi:hypothetical protein
MMPRRWPGLPWAPEDRIIYLNRPRVRYVVAGVMMRSSSGCLTKCGLRWRRRYDVFSIEIGLARLC